ncbi:MAG: Heme-binding protein A precursor [Firmicutes bacterium ADurb.Bin248]|nr:MAG: Heme-binding protein A precursor [Firmicutes bacterium ADurb.Bin248]HPK16291.1 ABC transporter substrate-binding protein [Clostridia bacterium]
MRKISVLALVLALAFCFGACVPQQADPVPTPGTTTTQPDAPAPTGSETAAPAEPSRDTLNLCVQSALLTTDGQGTNNLQTKYVLTQMYEGLYYFNEAKGQLEPRVAESYTISEDGKVYTFKLRGDVFFHNGDPVKASDVAFSFNRALTKPDVSSFASKVVEAKAVDDATVEVYLETPYAPFLVNLCNIFILSEREVTEQGEAFGTQISTAGCGPYMMTALDNDVKWTLEAFPQYYRGEAAIKYINYIPIADAAATIIAFEAGELDWIIGDTTSFQSFAADPKYKTEAMLANHCNWLAVNPDANDALANGDVRKAIAYAIDKEALNYAAFDGLAGIADYLENPDYNIGAPRSSVKYNYDPEKAKQLLAQAGYADGVDIGTLMYASSGYWPKLAQVIQANLAAVGIQCELEAGELASQLVQARAQDYDIYVCGASSYGDYDNVRRRFYSTLEGSYFVKYKGDKFDWQRMDQLMDESCAATDPAARLALTEELNDMLMETATYIPLNHKVQPYVWNADLNVVNQPNYYCVYDWSWN